MTTRERMARAIYETWVARESLRRPGVELPSWDGVINYDGADEKTADLASCLQETARYEVAAVLDVLMHPSDAVVAEGVRVDDVYAEQAPEKAVYRVFQAMLAAIREGK